METDQKYTIILTIHTKEVLFEKKWTLEGQIHGQNPVFLPGLAVSSMLL